MSRFDIRDISKPIIVAPMAGGPSTPQLAAAASDAGGLGMLAGGMLNPDGLAERIGTARGLTSRPLGVNLFVPQPSAGTERQYREYAKALAPEAKRYGVRVGAPRDDDDGWAAKLAVVSDMRPSVASFTFGLPSEQTCSRLHSRGIVLFASVTTVAEAKMAVARGIDTLIVQGPAAGGHRATRHCCSYSKRYVSMGMSLLSLPGDWPPQMTSHGCKPPAQSQLSWAPRSC